MKGITGMQDFRSRVVEMTGLYQKTVA